MDIIGTDAVVSFNYTLKNDDGEILDQSGDAPLSYLHGHDNIVAGLEQALTGKAVGDALEVAVPPALGYGEKRKEATQVVPKDAFGDSTPRVGEQFATQGPDGQILPLWVNGITDEGIEITFDHPLAGVTLHFSVTIAEIRAASAEEVAHGHPHGPGGHHH